MFQDEVRPIFFKEVGLTYIFTYKRVVILFRNSTYSTSDKQSDMLDFRPNL